jgi:hypothetical protein
MEMWYWENLGFRIKVCEKRFVLVVIFKSFRYFNIYFFIIVWIIL